MTTTVFMGSPDFALPVLSKLAAHYRVVGVVTQPDRPAGRGRVLSPPPVKGLADELGLPVIQPNRLSELDALQQIQDWSPQLIVVAAFGQILRLTVLNLPEFGCINVHASLLPRWRGAAPIQAAILYGDENAGVSIMRMDIGIDTGPLLSQKSIPVSADETAATLASKLAQLGADLLIDTLPAYLSRNLIPTPQDESLATYAPLIKKEEGFLDFSSPAVNLERKIRAYNPWPGAYTFWNGQILKIHQAHILDSHSKPPGQQLVYQGMPGIATATDTLILDELQLAGRKSQTGKAFLQGVRNWEA